MKKIFLLATLILSFVIGKSQTTYPINQYIGAPATLVTAKGGFKADSSLILPVFSDTAKANISTFIKNYAGTLIRVNDTIYVRSNNLSKWISLGTGGGGSTPNLQAVTTVGNITTDSIIAKGLRLTALTGSTTRLLAVNTLGQLTPQTYVATTVPYANASGDLTGVLADLKYNNKTLSIGSLGVIGEQYALDFDNNRATIYGNFNGMRLNVGTGTTGLADASKGFYFWNKGSRYGYFSTTGSGVGSLNPPFTHKFTLDSADLYIPHLSGTSDSMAVISATTGKFKAAAIPTSSGGTVTSISQAYGITNTPNPITTTGTIKADTTTSGLSGKYLRIIDTTNKWVQDVTKLNDSTIRVRKNNTNTDIILPKGTGGGGTQNLQQVTDIGNTTTNDIEVAALQTTGDAFIGKVGAGAHLVIDDGIGNYATIDATNLTTPKDLHLPDATGTFAMSVNGNFADSAGNIIAAIPTKTSELFNDGDNGTTHFISLQDLPSNLTIYATNVASGISTYTKAVSSLTDPDFNTVAVDIPTGTLTSTTVPTYCGGIISSANIIVGNPGIFTMSTIGNIRRTSGTAEGVFYYEVYKRTSGGIETLIVTSANTYPVSSPIYVEFNAAALFNNGVFTATDRVVIKFYGLRLVGGSNPSFDFQFGGIAPVRTTLPIPLTVTPANGVTSVATGYGLSGGTITAIGTLIADTSVSGLSGKYLRIIDTTNKWVNSVTKLNDTTIVVSKGGTNTNIVLPQSPVYTQSPIMSIVSNDSNIIYFNADTAAAWRGGGGTGTVTSISQGYGITNSSNPITTTGTVTVDTTTSGLSGKYLRIIDTSSLSSRINLKLSISDTSSMLTPYLRKVDTAVFQRKSISSYSIMANNTNAAANTTAQVFNDSSVKTYPAANITWTGGTAPTTLTTNTYTFTQVGKMVFLYIYLVYTNAASTPTSLTLQIPSDVPQPSNLGTTAAAGNYTFVSGLTFGRATITTQATTFGNTSFMRRNAGNTAYEMVTFSTNGAFRVVSHSFNYKTD